MQPQRLAYVLNIFPKISETFIAGELAELRRRGIKLRILSLLPPRPEPQHEIIQRAGLDSIVEYDPGKFLEILHGFQPDLIHAHFAREATEKAWELSRLTGIPFTFTAHGYDIHRKPPLDFRARAEAARSVITVSEANRDHIVKTFGVLPAHIQVIPCGVDTEHFHPLETLTSEESTAAPLVVCVARHVAVKNLGLLLDACAVLRDRGVRFRCAMVGDGPLRTELEAKRSALRLEAVVQMTGAATQSDVRRWWQRAVLGVLTSNNEGMPVSLMEAAASGVPVVATRVGGIPELVADGVTGLLVQPDDANALASAMETLLLNRTLHEQMRAAARQRAEQRFSVTRQVDSLLALWGSLLRRDESRRPQSTPAVFPGATFVALRQVEGVVEDPFGAAADQALPGLAAALNFETARHELKRRLPRLSGTGRLKLKAIRVTRHKPGRRAVVEYEVEVKSPAAPSERVTLLGKLRARRSGNEGYRQLSAFWDAGFDAHSADGISVPEPIGTISAMQMWFQRKVPGVTSEQVLATEGPTLRVALAKRVAQAIQKIHGCGVPTEKQHTMADELRILETCLDKVAALKPDWHSRLLVLMSACKSLGASQPMLKPCGSHRDFYPAQVLVDGPRLWLIDFDLYCLGDPGLDAGNFIGHVIEQALRERGDPAALADVEQALEDRFVNLAGVEVRPSVRAYTTLTLARHIFLSTRFPERAHLTKRLLECCEERLSG